MELISEGVAGQGLDLKRICPKHNSYIEELIKITSTAIENDQLKKVSFLRHFRVDKDLIGYIYCESDMQFLPKSVS